MDTWKFAQLLEHAAETRFRPSQPEPAAQVSQSEVVKVAQVPEKHCAGQKVRNRRSWGPLRFHWEREVHNDSLLRYQVSVCVDTSAPPPAAPG
jgi:hypothetical protein